MFRPMLIHFRACRAASRSTQSPIWWIKSPSSAILMKSPGGTMPRYGCCQRIKASTPSSILSAGKTVAGSAEEIACDEAPRPSLFPSRRGCGPAQRPACRRLGTPAHSVETCSTMPKNGWPHRAPTTFQGRPGDTIKLTWQAAFCRFWLFICCATRSWPNVCQNILSVDAARMANGFVDRWGIPTQ